MDRAKTTPSLFLLQALAKTFHKAFLTKYSKRGKFKHLQREREREEREPKVQEKENQAKLDLLRFS